MSALSRMDSTFRGPLAPGYCDIINLTVNRPEADLIEWRELHTIICSDIANSVRRGGGFSNDGVLHEYDLRR
jgi:hypothetical protein